MRETMPLMLADFYKTSHRAQYPEAAEYVFSNWIPRVSRIEGVNKVVSFGIQKFVIEYLISYFEENFFMNNIEAITSEYETFMGATVGPAHVDSQHIKDLHKLGYLPLEIKAMPEGTRVPIGVPMITVMNTLPEFFWLTNYVETLMSCEIWLPMTAATIADHYRNILDEYAMKTVGNTNFVPFQGHDFSMRGMAGVQAAVLSGTGHLTSFVGTDTIPAIYALENFYDTDVTDELVGCSVPATEHSVQCANGVGTVEEETAFAKRLITAIYPTGIVSMVSDTINLWDVITKVLPEIKEEVMKRDGKLVIRPDSGDPVDILCGESANAVNIGSPEEYEDFDAWLASARYDLDEKFREELDAEDPFRSMTLNYTYGDSVYALTYEPDLNRHDKTYYYVDNYGPFEDKFEVKLVEATPAQKGVVELLWDIFGGTVNELGYKELDPHIGAIYGDSITPERARNICQRLADKGFASTNVVFGIGSYTYQYNTRDTFGFAMKSTYAQVNGEERLLYKDPITDGGTKKSLKGLCVVKWDKKEKQFYVVDNLNKKEYDNLERDDCMQTVFVDGVINNFTSLTEIRNRLR